MNNKETTKTTITIYCKDGTRRVITCMGMRDIHFANSLGKDLEGNNFKNAVV